MRFLVILAALIAVTAAAAWQAGLSATHVEAALLLADIQAGSGTSLYKRLTPRPDRQTITWNAEGRRHSGDLYLPGEKARAGLVLVPGAAREGKDDSRLTALAESLTRARFLVLVPDIASARALEVGPADRLPVAAAVHFLKTERHMPAVGITAISYAAIPALMAAQDSPGADFVLTVGAPYDMNSVITFFTTGHYREGRGHEWQKGSPNAYGKWVFVRANARRMEDSADRALLFAIAERKMAAPAAAIDDLTARLSPQGRAVMALLDNDDPGRVPTLISALPAAMRANIAALDLSLRDLSGMKARVFLLHGRDDAIIPWTESAALAQALPDARLTVLDHLLHADTGTGSNADTLALWRLTRDILAERGG